MQQPCCACRAADWKAALSWLRWLLEKFGPDPLLLSRIGYVQLALGHLPAAEATFARAAAIAATPAYGTDKVVQAAVRRNQGLLLTANQDYKGTTTLSHTTPKTICTTCFVACHDNSLI